MHIEHADLADMRALRECHEVYLAAHRADEPDGPWQSFRPFSGSLAVGGGDPREVWLARAPAQGATGAVVGWYRLGIPDRENLDQAWLDLIVRPEERRRGIGRALLRHAAGRARANGRQVIPVFVRNGSPGEAFARSLSGTRGLTEVQRVMELGNLDAVARLREPAERAAAGYSLVSWTGPVPEEFIEQVADLYAALNDAPHSPEKAPEVWDAQRVRERVNALYPYFGREVYSVAARHDASGDLVALTQVGVDPANLAWGHQMITAVTKKHRGHRLGLLVKIAMLELLATAEPGLERIETWNAETNKHMIAVNEALGYRILDQPSATWWLKVAQLG
jgi:GNAT superfamily N-acetyltransferase